VEEGKQNTKVERKQKGISREELLGNRVGRIKDELIEGYRETGPTSGKENKRESATWHQVTTEVEEQDSRKAKAAGTGTTR